ncbi:prostaglandin E2 receptor EP4 subtype-like [Mizuhopecten yessoensis]|uniref:Prostaglandin E2 receptor EP4 subtype n=1 Tax=Mizuhopecten yessoensis TaxID=6573 RepID=A0A210Q051_MIZYE|nr:prostaglandin E2 receptor EP4 subtype-like [Mizuhopecten yessoensis]XP_021370759.1 prostaglandin E2 receptor EP4 subtype-like [Mizuhopecten yessoensis]XP_021370760.1 prostaglandin E2 receptor EP4 subtype-like [Mizuhopecten yessoensis]OWF42134.1 Prostaglandin E2 receptor EP4 subtype [Mizuhopecten yessoensis]
MEGNLTMTTGYSSTITTTDDIMTTWSAVSTTSKPGKDLPVLPVVMMLLFGGTGNILALILLIYTSRKHKWRTFYRLVMALAVSDFVGLVGPLPVSISAYVNNKNWMGGQPVCDFMSFSFIFAGMTSAMLAAAMSLDRFLAVWFPFFYSNRLSERRGNLTMVGIFTFAFLLACMPLMGVNGNVHQFPGTWCFFNQFAIEAGGQFFSYLYACLGIGMVGIMLVLNTLVIVVLTRRRGLRSNKEAGGVTSQTRRTSDVYNVIFLVVLMLVFTICWLPLMVRIIINQSALGHIDRVGDLMVMRLALTNQILDPWIYIILRKDSIAKAVTLGKRFFNTGSFLRRKSTDESTPSGQGRTCSSTAGDRTSDSEA